MTSLTNRVYKVPARNSKDARRIVEQHLTSVSTRYTRVLTDPDWFYTGPAEEGGMLVEVMGDDAAHSQMAARFGEPPFDIEAAVNPEVYG